VKAPPGARDLYAVLEVPRSASGDDLKKAYRRLAKKYHPDVCPNDKGAEDKFKEAANAYQILSDEAQRDAYDRLGLDGLRRGSQPGPSSPFEGFKSVEDIFSTFGDLFGDFFSHHASRSARGADLHLEIRVAFDEAVWGARRDVKLTRTTTCTACSGTGAPRGSRVDACCNCQGKGQVVHAQGFFMVQTECPQCRGRGKTIGVPCTRCRGRGLGSETATLSLTIPPGIDDGQTLRVGGKGEGTPGGTAGDLYVVIRVENDNRCLAVAPRAPHAHPSESSASASKHPTSGTPRRAGANGALISWRPAPSAMTSRSAQRAACGVSKNANSERPRDALILRLPSRCSDRHRSTDRVGYRAFGRFGRTGTDPSIDRGNSQRSRSDRTRH
jgi:curved DNA-binding protein CbpA